MYMPAITGELVLGRLAVRARADRRIRWTMIWCMALLALIAGTVSYLYMHMLSWRGTGTRVGSPHDSLAERASASLRVAIQ
jgi:H+/Cl- antiporter ClcA